VISDQWSVVWNSKNNTEKANCERVRDLQPRIAGNQSPAQKHFQGSDKPRHRFPKGSALDAGNSKLEFMNAFGVREHGWLEIHPVLKTTIQLPQQ
jgi:hypothetical protein